MARLTYVNMYRRMQGVSGRPKVTKQVALLRPVQARIRAAANHIARDARRHLNASKHRTGASTIKRASGKVDEWVILDDPAAMSIEFGRNGRWREDESGGRWVAGSAPVAPLRLAIAGLPRRGNLGRYRKPLRKVRGKPKGV